MKRCYAWSLALSVVALTGCSALIPPGAAAGMTGAPTRVKSINDYPEHFVYRIDDHRYITIKGNSHCDGTIYYYDTHLGIRTAVAATGLTLGGGAFDGYYAVDSEHVAIPAIVFSQTNGALLYVHYSNDGGRIFKRFLAGGYGWGQDVLILKRNLLYLARESNNPGQGIYQANRVIVDSDVVVDDSQRAVAPSKQRIDVEQVPTMTKSPSMQTNCNCEKITQLKRYRSKEMNLKSYCIGAVAFGFSILAGCTGLIPPGAAAGMNGTPTRVTSINDYPEHFVYRIDDHRYITIQGNSGCEGVIYYYDTRLGVRTAVAATGLTLGAGAFGGYYAVDSKYVAIPAIVFSQTNGSLLYIYYSTDRGKTFEWISAGGYGAKQDVLILKNDAIYIARTSNNPAQGLYEASRFKIASSGSVDQSEITDFHKIPLKTKSPSGQVKWTCNP